MTGPQTGPARPRGLSRKTLSPTVMAHVFTLACREADGLAGWQGAPRTAGGPRMGCWSDPLN